MDKIIKKAFEGADLYDGETYWQFTYCFSEKKSECGKVLLDEMLDYNHCLLLLEGNCKVFKQKNVLQPFRKWKDTLESSVLSKHGEELDSFERNILSMTTDRIQLATVGSGELIGAETLLPEQWRPLPTHKPLDKCRQKSSDFSSFKGDSVSLFTVEVSSPTVEYLLISKTVLRKFFKGNIKKNFCERFFTNLALKNKILLTKILFDPNTRPIDFAERNGKEITKIEMVRNKIYMEDVKKIETLKDSAFKRNPNPRAKFVNLWSIEKRIQKPKLKGEIFDEKIWKELNDTRRFMRINYTAPKEVQDKLAKSAAKDRGKSVNEQFSVSSVRAQSSNVKNLFTKPRKGYTVLPREHSVDDELLKIRSVTSKNEPARTSTPISYLPSRPQTSVKAGRSISRGKLFAFVDKMRSLSAACDTEASLWSTSVDKLGSTGFTYQSKSENEDKGALTQQSPKKTDAAGRARRKILLSRSSRRSQEKHHDEQSAFSQLQSPIKARKTIEKLASFKKAGKDTSVLFTEPIVHLSPLKQVN